GGDIRQVLTASQFLDSPTWSPDAKRLRYRQGVADSRNLSYWETDVSGGGGPRPLFGGGTGFCCGSWTSDGKYFLYGSRKIGEEGIWAVREKGGWLGRTSGKPVLLSTGPLQYLCSIP